jgi:peptidoglycan/xylan/chitin deacetylase (PgdA/CDA1 family)
MTKYLSLLTFVLLTAGVTCGYSQSKLVFTGTYQGSFYPFDSLLIEDLNTGSKIVKHYPDTVLKLLITGIDQLPDDAEFSLGQNYPNPYEDITHFNIILPEDDKLTLNIYNASGKAVMSYERFLPSGNHSFTFTGSGEKLYLLSAKTSTFSSSIKMLNSSGLRHSVPNLEYNGNLAYPNSSKKGMSEFEYNTGDNLVITGFMTDMVGSVLSDTLNETPSESTIYTFSFEKRYRIVFLMYHKITDSVPADEYERNSVDFENDLVYLRNQKYQILSMEDLPLLQSGELELISDGVIITFDDGYESNYSKAFPLLTKYKMPATFFLTTEWIDSEGFMTWSEVWLMSEFINIDGRRIFRMGSHTSSHPYLEQSAQYFSTHEDYLNFLNKELGDSKNWITDVTGQNSIFLSLPYGDGFNNEDIINKAIEIGYEGIRTSVWNSIAPEKMNIYSLPGIPILSGTSIKMIENYLRY